VTALLAVLIALGPGYDAPPTPEVPTPTYPTYIVEGDGGRMSCTPTMTYCWEPH
jgi:hypothetical protein